MENQTKVTKSKKANSNGAVRVSNETRKILNRLLDKANKKSFGKKIKADALFAISLGLLTDKHIKELQDGSLTNADRLDMAFKEFKKRNSGATRDEFLGSLLSEKGNSSEVENATFSENKTQQMEV